MEDTKFRILIVDDNPAIHDDFKKILVSDQNHEEKKNIENLKSELFGESSVKKVLDFSYEISSAFQSEEAIQLVKDALKNQRPFSLIFMDVLMPPGMDGIDTIQKIWEIDSDVQVVICTAYADCSWEDILNKLGINDNFVILKKPFENIEIRQMACCLTHKWQLSQQAGHRYDSLQEEIIRETEKLKKMFEKRKH